MLALIDEEKRLRFKLKAEPQNRDVKAQLAEHLLLMGREEKFKHYREDDAKTMFEQVLVIDGWHAGAHYHLGFIAYQHGRLDDAEDHLHKALDSTELDELKHAKANAYLAAVYFALGRTDEAEPFLQAAYDARQRFVATEKPWENDAVESAEQSKQRGLSKRAGEAAMFVKITPSGQTLLTETELYEDEETVLMAIGEPGAAIDLVMNRIVRSEGAKGSWFTALAEREFAHVHSACILEKLLLQAEAGVSHRDFAEEELQDELQFKTYISRLRNELKTGFAPGTDMTELIFNQKKTSRQPSTYFWRGPKQFIIYSRDGNRLL
jgi:tetratricopeptide (TPR) repeat protein